MLRFVEVSFTFDMHFFRQASNKVYVFDVETISASSISACPVLIITAYNSS